MPSSTDRLLPQAAADGTVDDGEKRVLGNSLRRAEGDGLYSESLEPVHEVRHKFGLG